MTYDFKLSKEDIESISKEVYKHLQSALISSNIHKEINEKINRTAKGFVELFLTEHRINLESGKILAPLVNKEIERYITSIPEVWEKLINDYFDTNNFKRKSLRELETRIIQLKNELGIEDGDEL